MNHLIPLALLFLSTAVLARSMPVQGAAVSRPLGAVIQSSDYDPAKDQTTFRVLNVSGKLINAMNVSIHTPDESASTRSSIIVDYLDAGLAPGAIEEMQRPGTVTAVIDLVMYSDGTAEGPNEDIRKHIFADRAGIVQGHERVNALINAALSGPAEKHPSEKVVAALKAELLSKTINAGYSGVLMGAIQDITNRYGSPHWNEPGWEAGELKSLAKINEERAAAIKAVL